MADDNDNNAQTTMIDHSEADDIDRNYKPPPKVSLEEILEKDKEDESLRRYKEALLGGAATTGNVIVDANDPRRVIVKKLALVVDGMPDKELDLSGDLTKLKQQKFKIKEGIQYRLRIDFMVQREIVHGLKYVQKTSRKSIPVDTMSSIMGSYAPKAEIQSFTTSTEEAPSGLLYRGDYSVSSTFTDDDKHIHLKWDWKFEISKDW